MRQKRNSIRNKILISIIITNLLTTLGIATALYYKSAQMIENNYILVLQNRITALIDSIDGMLQDVCNITINAACDDEVEEKIIDYLQDEDEKELEEISEILRLYCKENDVISSMNVLIPKKNQIITSRDYPVYRSNFNQEKQDEFIKNVEKNSGPVILEDLINPDEKVLCFAEPIEDEDHNIIGYICLNIKERRLYYDYIDDINNTNKLCIYLLNNEYVLTSTERMSIGEKFAIRSKSEEKEAVLKSEADASGEDRDNIYLHCRGAFSGCSIFAQIERKELLGDLRSMRKYVIGVVAVALFLSVFLALNFTKIVYEPVKRLTKAMKKVSEGELDTRVQVSSQDETAIMAKEFNSMLDQIQELIQRIVEEENAKKDAELEALQYQITPHFMYNTLNSIKCAALIKGEQELAERIEDFTELLQTCISKKGTFLTVADEIQILKNYIHLQEFRNGEEIQVEYDIMQEAEQCMVPRLILQPLVENAMLHGFDLKKQQGILIISAYVQQYKLYLEVADNGRGMSKEQIHQLLTSQEKKTKGLTAVGISNVRDRLSLYYGNKAELSYQSSSEGTRAMIYLPISKVGGEG